MRYVYLKSQIDSQVRNMCEKNNILLSYDTKTAIRDATDTFIHQSKGVCNSRKNRALHSTLKSLSNNTAIKCCKMDKGVGVVVMDSDDYFAKLDVIISDKGRFEELSYDMNTATTVAACNRAPWIARERSIQRYIRTYIDPMETKEVIDKGTAWKLKPTGSQPGRLYGMAKNHKEGCPLRPVLSAINTPEYALAKWLESCIKPFLNDNWSVQSSERFVNELNSIKPRQSDVCVSFDIKSLYTNVPLQEVVNDVANVLYEENSDSVFKNNIKKRVFKNILNVCSESVFLYKEKVYKQIDGLSMGSPLAPLLANWFVAKIEKNILEDPSIVQPKFYRRYVDDIFAVFNCVEDRDAFYKELNNAHNNLQFTMETVDTSSNSLPFLDVEISITQSETFSTKVYRKPTNTNVLMHHQAVAPTKWKTSIIRCFLNRAYRLSSTEELYNCEVDNIRRIFRANGYPITTIDAVISAFSPDVKKDNEEPDNLASEDINDLKQVYMSLPYMGKCSEKLHRRIKNEMLPYKLKVLPGYRTTKVGSYFSLKTKVPPLFKNNVVYKFVCPRDRDTQYIGETERQFFKRIEDHCSAPTSSKASTAVFDHMYQCDGCTNEINIVGQFSIVRQCSSTDLYSHETLYIRKLQPSLNVKLGPFKGCRVGLKIFN